MAFRLLFTLLLMAAPPLARAGYDEPAIAGGYRIYLAVVPAELSRSTLHGGAREGTESHHVIVSLIDEESGRKVTGAKVEARVREAGFPGPMKPLEAMTIRAAPAYGNYFPLHGSGPYRIEVEFQVRGEPQPRTVAFDYSHPGRQ